MKTIDFIMRLMLEFSIHIEFQVLAQIAIYDIRATSEIQNMHGMTLKDKMKPTIRQRTLV